MNAARVKGDVCCRGERVEAMIGVVRWEGMRRGRRMMRRRGSEVNES